MRNAPSVMFPVGRCRFYAVLLVSLGVLALAVLLLACWPLLSPGEGRLVAAATPTDVLAGVFGILLWLGWGAFALASWRRSPVGQLQWDAHSSPQPGAPAPEKAGVWRWHSTAYRDGTPLQQVHLALDLQSRMLLRLRNTDAVHSWVWVEQRRDPSRWSDLRRALVATRA
jgi:toxin CptA